MEQQPLFFEDIYDALRHVVQSSGGAKSLGARIFPNKEPDQAGRVLMDCLNSNRPEKLDPEQLITLLRAGHEAGCHSAIHFLAQRTGYTTPDPLTPDDEKAELQKKFIAATAELRRLAAQITGQ